MYRKEFLGLLPFSCKPIVNESITKYFAYSFHLSFSKRSNLHFGHINHIAFDVSETWSIFRERRKRDMFWIQWRVNTTIFQVMQIIWTCGSFCVGAPLIMSPETLDVRKRAQSALSQESPSKAARVSSFEFMGKTECKLINRHTESALT